MLNFFRKNWIFLLVIILGFFLDIGSKSWTFSSLEGTIFVPEVIAKIPDSYSKYLVSGPITEDLQKQLVSHIPISSQAILRMNFHNEYWVYESGKYFLLLVRGKEIHISQPKYPLPANNHPLGPRLLAKPDYHIYSVIPDFFSLRLAFNLGAIWSSFEGQTIMLQLFSIIAMLFILYLAISHEYPKYYQVFLGMIMAGAAGNLWDRIIFGGVRDFLDFYVTRYHWPTFNIADCLVVVGVTLFVWNEYQTEKSKAIEKKNTETQAKLNVETEKAK